MPLKRLLLIIQNIIDIEEIVVKYIQKDLHIKKHFLAQDIPY